MKYVNSAGGIFYRVNHEGQLEYLIVKRAKRRKEWHIPKGGVKNEELEEIAAQRETKEETGLIGLIIPGFRSSYEKPITKKLIKKTCIFLLYVSGGKEKPQAGEISELKWVTIRDSRRYIDSEQGRTILSEANNYLRRYLKEINQEP